MEFHPFPPSPASDEIAVYQGDIFERGNRLLVERLAGYEQNTGMPFEIESVQVSHSAQYPLIVRAHVRWTVEGHGIRSREMMRIDLNGYHQGHGEVFG
jgi:hypothetical protein